MHPWVHANWLIFRYAQNEQKNENDDYTYNQKNEILYIDNRNIKFNLYKEVDVVQAPQTAVNPCNGFTYVDENNFEQG